jgi:signal transduction histidine kinase
VHSLSPFSRDLLLAVSRELLFNIVKHAQVDTARVIVTGSPTCVRLEVADDGVGADPTATGASGMGLASVRRRILAAGGRFHIEARQGSGPSAVVELPNGGVAL